MRSNLYGGFWKRALARIIDLLIVCIPVLIVAFIIIGNFESLNLKGSDRLFLKMTLWSLVCWLLYSAYFSILTATLGYTLGKKLFNLKVVNLKGGKVSWIDAIYRETIGRILNEALLFSGYLFLAWTPRKTSFADLLCDTRVINNWVDFRVKGESAEKPEASENIMDSTNQVEEYESKDPDSHASEADTRDLEAPDSDVVEETSQDSEAPAIEVKEEMSQDSEELTSEDDAKQLGLASLKNEDEKV